MWRGRPGIPAMARLLGIRLQRRAAVVPGLLRADCDRADGGLQRWRPRQRDRRAGSKRVCADAQRVSDHVRGRQRLLRRRLRLVDAVHRHHPRVSGQLLLPGVHAAVGPHFPAAYSPRVQPSRRLHNVTHRTDGRLAARPRVGLATEMLRRSKRGATGCTFWGRIRGESTGGGYLCAV